MIKRKINKLLIVFVIVIFALCSILITTNIFASENQDDEIVYSNDNPEIISTYEQDFSDVDSVNSDFSAWYLRTMGGVKYASSIADSEEQAEENDTNFYVENNSLIRYDSGDIDVNEDTTQIAIATLTAQKYTNFELEVDYLQGSETYYWPVVAFRQSKEGSYYLEDGSGVFVQEGGKTTYWSSIDGGPYESGAMDNYDRTIKHTLKIRLVGLDLKVWVDDELTYSKTLGQATFTTGYISLTSVNNDCEFSNLKITELGVYRLSTETQEPLESSDSEYSLDNMATKVDEIDELDGLTQDNVRP